MINFLAFFNNSNYFQVVRLVVGKTAAGHLYSHLIPLVLLLVDGNFFTYSVLSQNTAIFFRLWKERRGECSIRLSL